MNFKFISIISVMVFFAISGSISRASELCDWIEKSREEIKENKSNYNAIVDIGGKSFIPVWTDMPTYMGVKMLIQDNSYNPSFVSADSGVGRWNKSLRSIEKKLDRMKVKLFEADFNNDGVKEKVMQVAWLDEKFQYWVRGNYAVDEFNNVSADMIGKSGVRPVKGEIVEYKDKYYSVVTFKYGMSKVEVTPLSVDPDPSFGKTGVYQGQAICEYEL
ncbi:hypothetical protein EUZ85_21280 [Hahella sp. KA22]|uniref:hypothetical protein n=1 Tax=Hahella sp. KA22 TaxID=1628392 RepID=UPI000FDF5D3A|nr:hypothetical protein [Hahella sp. KA22]AZZ93112.1 hypothetical protein ENC22_18695 [Hahella sp. KA22]QAY56486.1 hypothetical protein EUZ85_21280 [Hahella sp. KA22]